MRLGRGCPSLARAPGGGSVWGVAWSLGRPSLASGTVGGEKGQGSGRGGSLCELQFPSVKWEQ